MSRSLGQRPPELPSTLEAPLALRIYTFNSCDCSVIYKRLSNKAEISRIRPFNIPACPSFFLADPKALTAETSLSATKHKPRARHGSEQRACAPPAVPLRTDHPSAPGGGLGNRVSLLRTPFSLFSFQHLRARYCCRYLTSSDARLTSTACWISLQPSRSPSRSVARHRVPCSVGFDPAI